MDKLRKYVQAHKGVALAIIMGYIVFFGACVFPFSNELFPFDVQKGFMVIFGYGMIGYLFSTVLKDGQSIKVLGLTALFTVIGMGCRYLLEYGEVSNTMNFTPLNIALFIVIIPLYTVLVYCFMDKVIKK